MIAAATVALLASGRDLAETNANCDAAFLASNPLVGSGYRKNCLAANGISQITSGVCPASCGTVFTTLDAACTGFAVAAQTGKIDYETSSIGGLDMLIDDTSVCKGIMYFALIKKGVTCSTNAAWLISLGVSECGKDDDGDTSKEKCTLTCKAVIDNMDVVCPTADTQYTQRKKNYPASYAVAVATSFYSAECKTYMAANITFAAPKSDSEKKAEAAAAAAAAKKVADEAKATEARDNAKAALLKSNPDATPAELEAAGKKAFDASMAESNTKKQSPTREDSADAGDTSEETPDVGLILGAVFATLFFVGLVGAGTKHYLKQSKKEKLTPAVPTVELFVSTTGGTNSLNPLEKLEKV